MIYREQIDAINFRGHNLNFTFDYNERVSFIKGVIFASQSLNASISHIDISRTSGELAFSQTTKNEYTLLRQDLSLRGSNLLELSFYQTNGLVIYGMASDVMISGVSITNHFESWVHNNFTVIVTSIFTVIVGAFGGAFVYQKHHEKTRSNYIQKENETNSDA